MEKILIIKLGALGDVVRTIPVAEAIKKKHPDSHVSWVTKDNVAPLLMGNIHVDRIIKLSENIEEEFDIIYNFDIEREATTLAENLKAKSKYGFYREGDYPAAFNAGSEYYLNTIFDDQLKKENTRTYQEMMFEAAELPYRKERIMIFIDEKEINKSKEFLKENNIHGKLIGIHIGASPRWPSKAWSENKIIDFISKVRSEGYEVLIFAGPDEIQKQPELKNKLDQAGLKVHFYDPRSTVREFAAIVNVCDYMVCSDSFALHISLAMRKPTVGLFFCTSPHEIEGYGLLKKIVSPRLMEFFPERSDEYNEELVNSISADEVIKAIKEF